MDLPLSRPQNQTSSSQRPNQSIPCPVNLITTSAKTPVVFEPNVLETVSPGLEINQSLHTLKRGSSSKLGIEVHSSSNHDICIPRRTLLGYVDLVRSVTPVEVELKQDSKAAVEQEGTSASTKSDFLTMGKNSVNDDCCVCLTDEQIEISSHSDVERGVRILCQA